MPLPVMTGPTVAHDSAVMLLQNRAQYHTRLQLASCTLGQTARLLFVSLAA